MQYMACILCVRCRCTVAVNFTHTYTSTQDALPVHSCARKNRSCAPYHAQCWGWFVIPLARFDICPCVQNLTTLTSAIPEIWMGSKTLKYVTWRNHVPFRDNLSSVWLRLLRVPNLKYTFTHYEDTKSDLKCTNLGRLEIRGPRRLSIT